MLTKYLPAVVITTAVLLILAAVIMMVAAIWVADWRWFLTGLVLLGLIVVGVFVFFLADSF
jgi:drug/metabolite transporter (DMT)-like permease